MSKTLLVSNQSEFQGALNAAKSGDIIALAPGNYGIQYIKIKNFDTPVTITSQDENNPAVFNSITVQSSKGLNFTHLAFDPPSGIISDGLNSRLFLHGSSNITVSDNTFSGGVVNDGSALQGKMTGFTLFGMDNSNVVIEDNQFNTVHKAISIIRTDGLTIARNEISEFADDGMYIGDVRNLLVEDNSITEPRTWPGGHPDFIQITAIENGVIRDNFLSQGSGTPAQGIFMGTGAGNSGGGNVLVENNVVYTTEVNAIFNSNLPNVTISHNTIVGSEDVTTHTPTIRIEDDAGTTGLKIIGNIVPRFGTSDARLADMGAVVTGNVFVQNTDPAKPNFIGSVLENVFGNDTPALSDFAVRSGALNLVGKAGADLTHFGLPDPAPLPEPAPVEQAVAVPTLAIDFSETAPFSFLPAQENPGSASGAEAGNTVLVSSQSEFQKALSAAHSGDVIVLAPGNYGTQYIKIKNFDTPVTITSQDPNNPAVFNSIIVQSSKGLNFTHLAFESPDGVIKDGLNSRLFLQGSSNISVSDSTFSGAVVNDGSAAQGKLTGFTVYGIDNSNVAFDDNQFDTVQKAITMIRTDGLTIARNQISEFGDDGISIGDAHNVVVEDNSITDPRAWQGRLPDFIQISGIENGAIRDNFLSQGAGDPAQGILVGTATSASAGGNVLVENNIVHTAATKAIVTSNLPNVTISHNIVVGSEDVTTHSPTIGVEGDAGSTGLRITGNIVPELGASDARLAAMGAVVSGNVFIQDTDPTKPGFVGAVLENVFGNDTPVLSDFAIKPGAVSLVGNAGADLTHFNLFDDAPFGFVVPQNDLGVATVLNGGDVLAMTSDSWKQVATSFDVTADSRATLSFRVTELGGVHAIGFENDDQASPARFFELAGTETWGQQDFRKDVAVGAWVSVDINLGQYFSGHVDRIVFVTDSTLPGVGGTEFANIALHDALL